MANTNWRDPGTSGDWSITTNWSGLTGGALYPGQSPIAGDLVTIGGTNRAYIVTFDVPSATLSSLTIDGGNGPNHVTTLRMTAGNVLNVLGGVTLVKQDTPAAIDGAGTISVTGGVTAFGPVGSEGIIKAGTDTTGGVLDLTGTGFITSPFVFAIGTAAPTTLELDLAGGVVAPTAIIIENVNQTLEIGPLGALVVNALQNVTNGTILMAGGLLTDTSGISFGAAALSGSLSGFGTVTGPLIRSGSGTANTITALGGNLTLSSPIGSNSGLVFAIGSTAGSALQLNDDPGDGNTFTFLGSDGELALTGVAASGFNDSIVGLNVGSTLTPTNLVQILGVSNITVTSGQVGTGDTGTVTLSDGAVLHLSGITNASGSWIVLARSDSAGGTNVFLVAPAAPVITAITENDGGGINAGEAADGTPVVVSLTGTGAVAGDTLTINWGGQAVTYTLLAGDVSASSATVTVPATTITAQGDGTFDVTAALTDAAGNPGPNSTAFRVTIDTVAPVAPSITAFSVDSGTVGDHVTNDRTLTLSGTAGAAGNTVEIFQDGASIGTTVADIDGNWSLADTTSLADGTYEFTARATDGAGNQGLLSAAFEVTIDATAPGAPTFVSVTDDVAPVIGLVADNGSSNDPTLSIDGTAEPGSTVTVYDTDGTTVVGTGLATGGAGPIITSPLSEGAHTLTLKATDAAGNQSAASTAFHVTIDTVAPLAPVIVSVTDDVAPGTGAVADNGSSNDPTLTIGGTAEAGSTVTVYDTDGTTVLGTGVATGGVFTITTSVLGEGDHTLTATASDAAGNQSAASTAFQVTIDTTAPVAPVIVSVTDDVAPVTGLVADNGSSNDPTLTIGGTAEAGSTVTVYDTDGTTVLGTGVATGGAFTITTSVLGEGTHTLTARATDAAGNQGASSTAFRVTIDTVAPVAPSITAFSVDSGTVGDHVTNDRTLTLSGTAGAAGNTVEIFQDGASIGTTVADIDGNWSLADTTSLADGTYEFTARATDAAGNQGPLSAAFEVTIDATAPGAPTFVSVTDDVAPVIGLVADNGSSNDPTLSIDGTAEPGSTVTVYDTDGTTVVGTGLATGGAGPIITSPLSEGAHTLTLKATDAAGNQSAASTAFHVTIDTVAPLAPVIVSVTDDVAPVTGAVADNGSSNDPTLTIGGTAEAGSTVTVYDTDGTTVLGTGVATGGVFTITTSVLGEGAHTLTATASDAAGNQSAASTAFQVTIDTTAPVAPVIVSVTDDVAPVTGLVANNGSSNDPTLTIGGTAEAGSTVTVYDTDGTTVLGTGVATGGAFTITTSVLGEGTHALTARATDAAGNQGASSTAFRVTIDTVAPVAPSITAFSVDSGTAGDHLTNDRTLTLSGTAGAAGNTVEIFRNGVSIGTTVADIGGNWSLADATSLADGAYQFTARATDAAGNQGPLSAAFEVTIDATAPGAPTFGSVTDDVAPVIGLVADNGSSNDPTLSIDGTAEPGSTVTVYDTDGTTVVGTGLATGGAGPIITSPLSEGAHTLTLKATDAAGNQSAASTAFHVTIDTVAPLAPVIVSVTDDVAPVTGAVADNGSSNDPTLTIGGTAEAGSTVTVYDTDGTTVLGTGVATGGVFTITTSVLDEGAHALTARASDAAGNQSAASTAFHVTIDTSGAAEAPVIVSVTDDVAPVTGLVANNGSSNDPTLTIGGTAEAGSTVTVYDTDGTTVLGTGVATGGAFTITTSVLGEGAHALTARATDAAGNQGAYATAFHVIIDTVAPVAPSITAFSVDSGTAGDHVTNDRTLTLSGTAGAAGNTVEIFQDGASIGTTVADAGGNWSLADTTSLADGTYRFTARATDAAGNQGPLSAAFQVTIDATAPGAPTFVSVTDDVAPVIGLVADNGSSNDPTLSIDGTAEPGSTVTVYDTDGTTVVGTGLATGGAGPIITSPLSEGAHTLTLKATDAAGNQSAASTAFHVTIDTVAPLAPVIVSVTDDVAPGTGAVADNGSSNDPTLTIGGTAEAGSTVTVYDTDGTTVLGTGVATGGVFTITTSVLDEGAHALTATASDAAGNQSAASTAFQVTIDTTAPVAPVIVSVTDDVAPVTGLVANNGSSNDTTLTIGGTAEAGSTVTVYDTDGTTVLGTGVATGGAFTITTSVLGEGTHALTARATDAAGNQGASTTAFRVTIDTVAPVAPSITAFSVDSGTVGDHVTNDRTLTLSGTAGAAGNTVEIFQDGASVGASVADIGGNWSLADTTSLADGTYQFTARATDAAGNQGPLSAAFQVTIDATAPGAPTFVSVTDDAAPVIGLVADNGSSNDPTLAIDGTAEPGSTVTVYDTDGTTVVGTGLATGGAGPIITSPLSEGAHTLTLKATDAAGNQSAASTAFHVTIDTVAPLAPVIVSVTDDVAPGTGAVADNGSSNDPTLTIGGTAEAGSTVTVYDTDGTTVLGTGVATGGVFTITTSVLDEGAHALTARASDAAGNQSAASTAFQVTIDTTAPLAPVIVSVTDDVAPVTGLVANNGSSNDATPTIGGTAEAGSTVTVYDTDGTTVLGTGVATGGAFTITTSVLGEGTHALTARATDAAGNQGASSTAFHVTIDTVAPVAPSITAFSVDSGTAGDHLTNDRTLTLSGTAGAAGNTVEIFRDGVSIGTTVADAGGNWSLADATSLADGAYQFTARATDAAGNQGPLSAAFQVTIDATAPGAPTFGSVTDNVAPVIGLVADNGSSNDPTLSIDGTAEPGSTVTVYDTDGTTVVGTGVATGGAGPITTSPLSEGVHTLTLKATDAAGNQSAASTAFHVTIDTVAPLAPVIVSVTDDVAPVTGAVADNGSSNDATLTIGGTAEAGSTVTVYDTDGTTVLGTGVATGGVFTITTSVLDEGAHALTARASDAAGNQSAASTAFQVIIDTTAPVAPVIVSVTDDVAPVTGLVANNGSSNDTTLTIGGTAEAGSTVTVYDTDGTTVLGTGVATGGAFTITTSVLGEGTHTLTARATDAAGNQGASSTAFHVTIDTVAPVAPSIVTVTDDVALVVGAVADNGSSNDSTLTIGGTADAGSTVTLYDTDGTTVVGTGLAASGVFTITTSVLGEGTHTLTARATDAAGNQGASSTAFHVTIDTLPPAVAITTIEGGDDLINAAEAAGGITVSGTAEIGSTLTVNGAAVTVDASGNWTTSVAPPAVDGPLTVTAVATDAAGNTATATHALTVDTAPPAAPSITSIPENGAGGIDASEASDGTPVVVDLTGTGAVAGDTLTIHWGGQTVTYTLLTDDISSNSATVTVPLATITAQGEGTFNVTAMLTDAAGNRVRELGGVPGDGRHAGAERAVDHLDPGEWREAASTPARPWTTRRWWWT